MKQESHVALKATLALLLTLAALVGIYFARSLRTKTLRQFYFGSQTERGMWKYDHYLDAYQRHFAPLARAGRPLAIAEVGVQSGGSIPLWKSLLGPRCHYYGIDINPASTKFADSTTTITIGDQSDDRVWDKFYDTTVPALDILIDDGSHQAHDMLLTLTRGFPHMNAGGIVAIEDFQDVSFADWVLCPAAKSIGAWSANQEVASVHFYPFLLVVRKAGPALDSPPASFASARDAMVVGSFQALREAMPRHPGGLLALENASWGSFLAEGALCSAFQEFRMLNQWGASLTPPGCGANDGGSCIISIMNSADQSSVIGIHVFPTRLVVELAAAPPLIEGVRVGKEWVKWYHNGTGEPAAEEVVVNAALIAATQPRPEKVRGAAALVRTGSARVGLHAVALTPTGAVESASPHQEQE